MCLIGRGASGRRYARVASAADVGGRIDDVRLSGFAGNLTGTPFARSALRPGFNSTRRRTRRARARLSECCSRRAPLISQRLECGPDLRCEKLRLFPGSEVAALVDLVEVSDVRVARLDPAARRPPDLSWKRREAERDLRRRQWLRTRGRRVRPVRLPIRSSCRGTGAGEPVQRDVVEDVIACQVAGRLPIEKGA